MPPGTGPVVLPARHTAVVRAGQAAVGDGDDVVDVAEPGVVVAAEAGAASIADLDGPAELAGEQPVALVVGDRHLTGAEDVPLDVGVEAQDVGQLASRQGRVVPQLGEPVGERLEPGDDGDERAESGGDRRVGSVRPLGHEH